MQSKLEPGEVVTEFSLKERYLALHFGLYSVRFSQKGSSHAPVSSEHDLIDIVMYSHILIFCFAEVLTHFVNIAYGQDCEEDKSIKAVNL